MNQRTFESLPLAVLPAWSHDDSGAPKARDRTLERPALRNVRPLGFGEHQRAPAGSMLAVSSSSPRLERTVDVVLRPAPGCPARCDRQTFTCHAFVAKSICENSPRKTRLLNGEHRRAASCVLS